MKTYNIGTKLVLSVALFGMGGVFAAGSAQAGHNGSPALIKSAIASNSVDAIEAELERSEYLVCAACSDLVTPLVDHLDYRVRKVAAWWIARRGINKQVYVAMLGRLSQPDSFLARNAADVLGELGYAGAVPALSAAMSNPIYSAEARAAMARALGTINRPSVVAPLTTGLAAPEAEVRIASLKALQGVTGLHDGTAVAPLVADADAGVRAQAAMTLGTFRARAGTEALVTALGDASPAVRKQAAWALGRVGASASVAGPALGAVAANDPSPFVRSLAAVSLTQLSR